MSDSMNQGGTGVGPVEPSPRAPFDPRQGDRVPAPRPPSAWLEPVSEAPAAAPDEVVVITEDGEGQTMRTGAASTAVGPEAAGENEGEPVDPATGATPTSIAGRRKGAPRSGRRLEKAAEAPASGFTAEQRLLVLDTWQRSGLPATEFAPLVGVSKHTLYAWKERFEEHGPAGLSERKRGGPSGSRLPEVVKRAVRMLKEQNPDWGVERISAMLARGEGFAASPGAVGKVLKEWGYELREEPTRAHGVEPKRFERARPNQLWQTDLFTFLLKRQNQRVWLVAFLDDHSRFVVSHGLHASQSGGPVLEVLRSGIASYGTPEEVLTDNGTQYVTWRGTTDFSQECRKRGINHIVASPRRPQTLGKTERFWGSLWRECVETAVFHDLADARQRIAHYIDWYNFRRPHQGIGNVAPADRFFGAAPTMLATLRERVAANALELARGGAPKAPFYLAGNVNGQAVSVHAEGDRLLLKAGDAAPVEVALTSGTATAGAVGAVSAVAAPVPSPGATPMPVALSQSPPPASPWTGVVEAPPPGVSPLDGLDDRLRQAGGAS